MIAHTERTVARMPAPAGSETAAVAAIAGAPGTAPPVSSAPAATMATIAGVPARSTDAEDRAAFDSARAALERHDPAAARAALARMKGQRLAEEREALRRMLQAYPADGGP